MNFTKFLIATCMSATVYSYAQDQPTKVVKIGEKVESLNINPVSGVAVVESGSKIFGITNNTAPIWSFNIADFIDNKLSANDISNTNFSNNLEVENIYGSKFVVLSKGLSKAVVNTSTGEIVYSSKKIQVSPIDHQMVKDSPILLISYIKDKEISTTALDLNSGKQLWDSPIGEKAKMLDKLTVFLNAKGATAQPTPIMDAEKNIYALINSNIYKFSNSGKVLWQTEKSGISNFDVNKEGNALILLSTGKGLGGLIGSKQALDILNTETGQSNLAKPLSVNTVVYIEDLGSQFMLGSYSGSNLYNYNGETQWKKSIKGEPKMMVKSEGGYIFITKNTMNFIDVNGKELWRRDVEISDNKDDQIFELMEKNGKIFYITSTYANIVDKSTGEKIWKKNLKLEEKRPTFFTYNEDNGEYVIYNDEKLYKYDGNSKERPDAFAKINVKKEKEINSIEKRNSGYMLSGLGEIILVDNSGKLIYQKLYQEPGGAGRRLSRIGLNVLGAAASLATSTASTDGGQTNQGLFLNEGGRETATQMAGMAFKLDQKMSKRFNASSENQNFKFYFSKEGDKKVLVKVNKDTGAEEKKFLFNSNKPNYSLDDFEKILYYANENEVQIFNY